MTPAAAAPATMMALRAHARGGPEQLVYESAPVPVPGPGEALVAVHAAAITFAELSWEESWTTRDGRDRTPVIPSHEVSGTPRQNGPDRPLTLGPSRGSLRLRGRKLRQTGDNSKKRVTFCP